MKLATVMLLGVILFAMEYPKSFEKAMLNLPKILKEKKKHDNKEK